MATKRKSVFVSYAHADRKWADELQTHLAPWIREGRLTLWDDSAIAPGAKWQEEISNALGEAAVAVLLVSPDFLASHFINSVELPAIIRRAQDGNLRIAWVAVRHSAVEATPLSHFQAVNDPSRPLADLPKAARDKVLVDVA